MNGLNTIFQVGNYIYQIFCISLGMEVKPSPSLEPNLEILGQSLREIGINPDDLIKLSH